MLPASNDYANFNVQNKFDSNIRNEFCEKLLNSNKYKGQKLTLADCSKRFIRLSSLNINNKIDWSYIPMESRESAESKAMTLIDIKEDRLIFVKDGLSCQYLEFDISNNDSYWMLLCEFQEVVRRGYYL